MTRRSSDAPVQEKNEQAGDHPSPTKDERVVTHLPEIPTPDLSFDFSSIIGPTSAEHDKIQKRASNVMKLAQENEKLKAELKAMTDRLEAAERRRAQLSMKEQKVMEEPSS